jgi:hypothetical protein
MSKLTTRQQQRQLPAMRIDLVTGNDMDLTLRKRKNRYFQSNIF